MKLNDNTILRIKVPAHLYESVKAQLTLKEGKNDYGMPGSKTIKEKKTSEGPKNSSTTKAKKPSAPKTHEKAKNPNASQKGTGAMYDEETSKLGAGVSETKKMGLEELHALAELLHAEIAKLEEKAEGKEEKAPVEEEKEKMEEAVENVNEEDYDKLSDMKRAGIYSKEDIANYLGLDPEKDRERINYWYEKLGSTKPSYAAGRGRSLRRRW